jgi:proline dehydrogenase
LTADATNAGVVPQLNFTDIREAYRSKSTFELVRAIIVYRVCAQQWIVNNADLLLKRSIQLFGERLTIAVVQRTMFAHFCAGQDETSIRPTVEKLRRFGVGSILDYAAEADIAEAAEVEVGETKVMEHTVLSDCKQRASHCSFFKCCSLFNTPRARL